MPGANLLPVLDSTGILEDSADLDVTTISVSDIAHINAIVDGFHTKRRDIHSDLLRSSDPVDRLICRRFLTNEVLTPRLSAIHDRRAA